MNQNPENYGERPADTRIGAHVGGHLDFVTNKELDHLVLLIRTLRPASMILSKKQAMEYVARSQAENLILTQRHARLQAILVAFKVQLTQLPEDDHLRMAFAQMFDTFMKELNPR